MSLLLLLLLERYIMSSSFGNSFSDPLGLTPLQGIFKRKSWEVGGENYRRHEEEEKSISDETKEKQKIHHVG